MREFGDCCCSKQAHASAGRRDSPSYCHDAATKVCYTPVPVGEGFGDWLGPDEAPIWTQDLDLMVSMNLNMIRAAGLQTVFGRAQTSTPSLKRLKCLSGPPRRHTPRWENACALSQTRGSTKCMDGFAKGCFEEGSWRMCALW